MNDQPVVVIREDEQPEVTTAQHVSAAEVEIQKLRAQYGVLVAQCGELNYEISEKRRHLKDLYTKMRKLNRKAYEIDKRSKKV